MDSSKSHGILNSAKNCRVMVFSSDGEKLAWCDGEKLFVYNITASEVAYTLDLPRTRCVQFSPKSGYLATWEPYAVTKDTPQGSCNLRIWSETDLVMEYIQKKQDNWCPQWTKDEAVAARNVSTEVHFYDGGRLSGTINHKLRAEGLGSYSISPGPPPYHVAIFVRSHKGSPAFVRLYQYPAVDTIIASRSFFRGDTVSFYWNRKGSALLALCSSDIDKTGASYYGEQSLHYLSTRGDGNLVQLEKKGPVYAIEWSPNSTEFCVVYGFMPSRTTLFNHKCEVVFDFGTAHRNTLCYNPHGNILLLGGFGNLRGEVEFWNTAERKSICKTQASDTTQLEWSPDGSHVVTATTAPRLREGNGYKIWHFSGTLLKECSINKPSELLEVKWQPRPVSMFPVPNLSTKETVIEKPKQQSKAYVPPALRGKQITPLKIHEEETQKKEDETLSKSALKNKKKRDVKKKTTKPSTEQGHRERSLEQQDVLAVAAYITGPSPQPHPPTGTHTSTDKNMSSDTEKKLKNLRKKLKQIEDLKKQQESGKVLEANQVEKIKGEKSLLEEIEKLQLAS